MLLYLKLLHILSQSYFTITMQLHIAYSIEEKTTLKIIIVMISANYRIIFTLKYNWITKELLLSWFQRIYIFPVYTVHLWANPRLLGLNWLNRPSLDQMPSLVPGPNLLTNSLMPRSSDKFFVIIWYWKKYITNFFFSVPDSVLDSGWFKIILGFQSGKSFIKVKLNK